jgi:hypothetical protein
MGIFGFTGPAKKGSKKVNAKTEKQALKKKMAAKKKVGCEFC